MVKLSANAMKNKINYVRQYNKENYTQKKVELKNDEAKLLERVLKEKNMSFRTYLMKHVKEDLNINDLL